jgi:spermidine synthase
MRTLWLYLVFLASGFAALLYQVVWQRALFGIFGINIESVTIVVTAFMLGLGLGSLTGGAISKNPARPALLLFGLVEMGIGVFGVASLPLFRAVGALTLGASPVVTALVTFLLTLVPTMLMGSTLPLLVAHSVRASKNVGKSVGMLYYVNTLGSALASFASVVVILHTFGESGSTRVAACINLTLGATVVAIHFRTRRAEAA